MKYLIIGGNGFVGGFLKEYLIRHNHFVETAGKSSNNDYVVDLSCESIQLNKSFDVIIHTAGIVHNPSHAYEIDTSILLDDMNIHLNLLRTLKSLSFNKLIYLSSVSVYGVTEGLNIDIHHDTKPVSSYGISKLIGENLFLQLPEEKVLILRLPLINGSNPKGNIRKVIESIKGSRMVLFKGNLASKSIIELPDLCKYIMEIGYRDNGIQQIKSYDVLFNDFVQSLDKKKIVVLPIIIGKIFTSIAKLTKNKKLNNLVLKMFKSLTFKSTKTISNEPK